MKFYKSYILAGLIALGFTACDTDDLERDINALIDRVENYEAQVQKLNDDMNIIRVLLDGNKTISEWSYDGSTYTLKLSNGETLTLTDGVIGTNYPSIEIDDNGNWIIAGKDSGIRAVADDGDDATFTPQFKIEDGYWCVSHDNGQTWSNLGVSATGTPTEATSPIKNIDTTTDPNYIIIILSDNSEHKIPVVKDLICAIQKTDLADDGLLYLGYGASATIKVDVNIESGDIIRPVVPAEWKAEITTTDYSSKTGAQTLDVKVIAPMNASKCVVTIEVNRGANTVTDEIVARTNISNYWDEFQAGFDIVLGNPNGTNCVINKKNISLKVEHITSASTNKTINSSGIYFVDENVEALYDRFGISDLIIIGTNPEEKSILKLPTNDDYFNLASSGKGLILKNIDLDLSDYDKDYVVNEGKDEAILEYIIFDKCRFELKRATEANIFFVNIPNTRTNIHINNISFYSNNVEVAASSKNIYMVRLQTPTDAVKFTGYEGCEFVNNIFYSPQNNKGCSDFSLLQANMNDTYMDAIKNITVSNNTLVNLLSKNGMIRSRMVDITSNNNLIWNDYAVETSSSWICAVKRSDVSLPQDLGQIWISNNICYDETGKTCMLFHSSYYRPDNYAEYNFNNLSEDPFEMFDIANGIFKVSSEYVGIGSSLE